MKLEELCESRHLRAEVKYGAPENEEFKDSNPWTVTLKYKGRQMTVPFYTGMAINGEPSAADVLACLISDAEGVKCARSFEDWASDLGYDSDSRKAEKVFKACERERVKIEKLLGEDYEVFAKAAQDY